MVHARRSAKTVCGETGSALSEGSDAPVPPGDYYVIEVRHRDCLDPERGWLDDPRYLRLRDPRGPRRRLVVPAGAGRVLERAGVCHRLMSGACCLSATLAPLCPWPAGRRRLRSCLVVKRGRPPPDQRGLSIPSPPGHQSTSPERKAKGFFNPFHRSSP